MISPLDPGHPRMWHHTTGNGPPPCVSTASPYPGLDRGASGCAPVTPGAFTPRPSRQKGAADLSLSLRLRGFKPLNLATGAHSLARFSTRTLRPRHLPSYSPKGFLLGGAFRAVADCPPLVSGSFHPLSRVLFSFLSRY